MRKLISILCFSFLVSVGFGQAMTNEVLEYEDFLTQVLANHPLAQRANLQPVQAARMVQAARGNFDPKLVTDYSQKTFDGKNYFRILEGGLVMDTRSPVSLRAGYQQTSGTYLNPELTVPQDGLLNAGVEVNLGKGLFIDKRRAELQKAETYLQVSEVQRQLMLNDLIVEATNSYWSWVYAWNSAKIYEEAMDLAQTRFEGVRVSFREGDKPAIDTTEALIQVQNRTYMHNEALMKLFSARMTLSTFLWDEEGNPLELLPAIPAPAMDDLETIQAAFVPVDSLTPEMVLDRHPAVKYYDYQLEVLDITRRYQVEQLKPKAALKYDLLAGASGVPASVDWRNYKLGVAFSFPLFLRQERGQLAATKIEMQNTNYVRDQKRREIEAKFGAIQQKIDITGQQIDLYSDAVRNYQRLLNGETRRFQGGESSLFLVNSREQSLIKAEIQYLQQLTSYPVLIAEFYRASGGLFEMME